MSNRQRRSLILSASVFPWLAFAQPGDTKFPSRPVKLIVPFAPGGSADLLARVVAEGLEGRLGQTFIVENRVGASGNVGTAIASQARPDGYTLLLGGTPPLSIAPNLYAKLGYDAVKDFAPIALVGTAPNMIVVNPALPIRSMHDLVSWAKTQPAGLSYVSAGIGGTGHLAFELFLQQAGLTGVHVPNPNPLIMTMGGHVPVCIYTASASLEFVMAGKLRALAVTGTTRMTRAPNVPTLAEAGFPAANGTAWYGLLAPVEVPAPIRRVLSEVVLQMLADTAIRKRIEALGCEVTPMDESAFGELVKSERVFWAGAVKRAKLKAD